MAGLAHSPSLGSATMASWACDLGMQPGRARARHVAGETRVGHGGRDVHDRAVDEGMQFVHERAGR